MTHRRHAPAGFGTITALVALIVASMLQLALPTGAIARTAPGMPPRGTVLLGVGGHALSPTQFDAVAGGRHAIHLITVAWDEQRYGGWDSALQRSLQDADAGGYRLMVHVGPENENGRAGRSPGAVARGDADAYLLDLGEQLNASGQFIYLRPPAEMNAHWSVWSAYDRSARARGRDFSTSSYRRAFIRMTLVARGGSVADINRSLRRNGMPPLRTSQVRLTSSGRVAMVFNPQARGAPDIPGNMPIAYYPGAAWVDYVANDLYQQNGNAAWSAQDQMYRTFRAHPFMVAEYAPWGTDDPAFVQRMFAWAAARPRTVALMYFNGTSSTTFRLSSKPRTLAAYRRLVRGRAFQCPGLSATSAWC